ncbi:Pentatricopeptide repeat-containing protein [Heracleum sosnowskyi]|uniref:Pentatricopeptide repeat-containing protein n=1 Tax=Heracleum sosnowskyi TaxID=360622 RepID=A0AAD8H0C5_9APIA|nr:Pentatricopeptide repeat-containing protein [Heracleum sosnowskyi]
MELNMLCTSVKEVLRTSMIEFLRTSLTEFSTDIITEYKDLFADLQRWGFNVYCFQHLDAAGDLIGKINYVTAAKLSYSTGKIAAMMQSRGTLFYLGFQGPGPMTAREECTLICDKNWIRIRYPGFAENKFTGEAFKLFCWMLKESAVPNYATIANILPVCAGLEENAALRFGKEIHSYVLHRPELMDNISVTNALMGFYSRTGRMNKAECLFARMKSRDLVSWNSLIAGYSLNGESLKALELFHDFTSVAALKPDHVTLVSILPACSHLCNMNVGKQIHGHIARHPGLIEDTAVGNALISFYAKCNDIKAAYRIFKSISKRDLISWNTMLDAFAESGLETEFVDMFKWMFREGITPDSITIISTVQLCATLFRVDRVKEAHAYSIKTHILLCNTELKLRNALIDAYGKCGNMLYASSMFESLSENRDVVTCNSIISGYVNCGSHDNAHMIFTSMSERDLTTWNLMVRVYAENDHHSEALLLFLELQNSGLKPDALSLMSILPVCSQIASIQLLKQCHGYVVRACFDDAHLLGALIDIYSKCGSIGSAYNLFKYASKKDLVMFTAMVGGYAMHGMGSEALGVYSNMLELGIEPDHVIITTILCACSHAGLLNEGLNLFDSIEKLHRLEPTMEQYGCVVDLLARAGRVNDAYSFVTNMPVEANANIWGALLGACRNHHEVDIGCDVADRLFAMEENNIGNYVVMSNLYAANARWDGVLETRKLMKTRELKKSAGSSWIEVEGKNNVFIAGDCSHPYRNSIYSTLFNLDTQIRERFKF